MEDLDVVEDEKEDEGDDVDGHRDPPHHPLPALYSQVSCQKNEIQGALQADQDILNHFSTS